MIPNSVFEIGEEVFSYCSGLTSVTLSNALAGAVAETVAAYYGIDHGVFYGGPLANITFASCPSLPSDALITYNAGGPVSPACPSLPPQTLPFFRAPGATHSPRH